MSNVIFEDRSTYNPAKDAIARIALVVECAPGQMESVKAFMSGVATQAGVYHVEFDADVIEPAAAPVAEPELAQADAAEPSSSVVAVADEQPAPQEPEAATDTAAPVDEAAAAAPTGNSDEQTGAPDGEQPIQLADSDRPGTDIGGQGSDAEAGDTPAVGPADEDSGISGTAGEVGAEPQ